MAPDVIPKLQNIIPKLNSFKEIGVHRGLAQLGDSITNASYSVAKSRITGRICGRNVSRTILSQALKNAEMKPYGKNRGDSHDMANTAEAFIGYMFASAVWTFDDIVQFLTEGLYNQDLNDEKSEIVAATTTFTILLRKIKELLSSKFG